MQINYDVHFTDDVPHKILWTLTKSVWHGTQRVEHVKASAFSFQGAYAGFVYTYAVAPPMSLPHKTAGYLASIFWAAITAGRLLSIPLSYRFQPVRLLMFNIVRPIKHLKCHPIINEKYRMKLKGQAVNWWYSPFLCFFQAGAIVTVLMLLIFYTSNVFLFVGTCLCGLFLSSIFPCMLAYTEDILDYQGIMMCL